MFCIFRQNDPYSEHFIVDIVCVCLPLAVPAAIYRSAPGPEPESAPRSAFWAILGTGLGVPQTVLFECFLAFFGP